MALRRKPAIVVGAVVQLTYDRKHTEPHGRIDHYYTGIVTVNGVQLPFRLHLMYQPTYSTKGYAASIEVGEKNTTSIRAPIGEMFSHVDCNLCSGSYNGQGGGTGPTALALWEPIIGPASLDVAERDGVKKINLLPGWHLFDFNVPRTGPQTKHQSRARFYHEQRTPVHCPVHGDVVLKNLETDF